MYLEEIDRFPLLSAEQEQELAMRVEQGDEAAALAFEQANLRLVVSVAKKFLGRGLSLLDLIQEGNMGLMVAVRRYSWRMGTRFSTYAAWWIRQSIQRAVSSDGYMIRIPVHVGESISRLDRVSWELAAEYGREPGTEEIAAKMGVSPGKVMRLRQVKDMDAISLQRRVHDDDDAQMEEIIPDVRARTPEEAAIRAIGKEQLQHALRTLSPREEQVIRWRYGLDDDRPRTLAQIGIVLGLTRERVRQIENRAMDKLRLVMLPGGMPLELA